MKIARTSNFDEDYFEEVFVPYLPACADKKDAQTVADILNKYEGGHSKYYFRVVENDYKLRTITEY